MRYVLTEEGIQFIFNRLNILRFQVEDLKPGLQLVADEMLAMIETNFTSQGRRGGGEWAALKPGTVERKAKLGRDPRILYDTKELLKAATRRGASGNIIKVTENSVEVGVDAGIVGPKAAVHHTGGRFHPKRDYMKSTYGDRAKWRKIMERYIFEASYEAAIRAGHMTRAPLRIPYSRLKALREM